MKREEFEQDQEFYTKILARALVKRAAANVWVSKFDEAVKDFDEILANPDYCKVIGDRDVAALMKDKAATQLRQKSQQIKIEGDRLFYHEQIDDALAKYNEAVEVDQENEYALANIGVIHLKKLEYPKCIDYSSRALSLVENF